MAELDSVCNSVDVNVCIYIPNPESCVTKSSWIIPSEAKEISRAKYLYFFYCCCDSDEFLSQFVATKSVELARCANHNEIL